jgi:hypothetical protein
MPGKDHAFGGRLAVAVRDDGFGGFIVDGGEAFEVAFGMTARDAADALGRRPLRPHHCG